jgi:Ca2+-binding RTX toxin-like protein
MRRVGSILGFLASVLFVLPVAASGASAPPILPPVWVDNYGGAAFIDGAVDVVALPNGTTFVVTPSQVARFDPSGTYVSSFGTAGSGQVQFGGATGIDLGPDGNLYISESGNDRVQVVTTTGRFVRFIGSSGSGAGELDYPEDVAFDSQGRLLVVDRFNSRMQVFTTLGAYVTQFSDSLGANPMSVAVNSAGRIFVSNLAGNVEIYSPDFVHKVRVAAAPGSIYAVGVAIDKADRLWVSMTYEFFSQAKVYGSDFLPIGTFGGFGSAPNQFGNLGDLTIDHKGRVLLADQAHDRISVWEFMRCNGHPATWIGTNGPDVFTGTAYRDVIVALGGNDTIAGGAGNDVICLGPGADVATGGSGRDRLLGHGGNDQLRGGGGRDIVYGHSGRDVLFGGGANDVLRGGGNRDILWGGTGNDRLEGNSGNDTLKGQEGADAHLGGGGIDICRGGLGIDTKASCETATGIP